jgi:DNA-binding LytR/AlgR family response regulator
VRQPLASFTSATFARVHRSELVRVGAVTKLEPLTHGDALLTLVDGTTTILSRTYRRAFQEAQKR